MDSPVTWIGSKKRYLSILYAAFPLEYQWYVEPFGGSCSVLLGKPQQDTHEVYNDSNQDLINLFRCIRDRPLRLIWQLGFHWLNARDDFKAFKGFLESGVLDNPFLEDELAVSEILLPPPQEQEIQQLLWEKASDHEVRRAAMFLRLIRYSYASNGASFGRNSVNLAELFRLIHQCSRRLQNVVIENWDFETVVRHYDRPDAFFYCDPPYFQSEGLYQCRFAAEDHRRLQAVLSKAAGKWLLSYNDCPEIRALYRGFEMLSFSRLHGMVQKYRPGEAYPELLIGNYDLCERERGQLRMELFDSVASG